MVTKYFRFIIAISGFGLLVSCATPEPIIIREPVEVMVPVAVNPVFPDALITPYKPVKLPVFISPSDPAATAALSEEELMHLRALIRDLVTRDNAWQAFAKEYSQ